MDAAPAQIGLLTPTQQRAVIARGNVLVMAGAGTGKTKTLVERCLHCLEYDGAMMDELLVVTFTEAAAADMRDRLRRAIESRVQAEAVNRQSRAALEPGEDGWAEQLARFDLAHIGTLHSFCLKLVREHFYELGLDPRLAILNEGEARQLASETLVELFSAHYARQDEFSLAVQDLIQSHGGGRDEAIRKLVLQLHHYSQARPDAAGWLARQREKFSAAEPADWERWLLEAITKWRDEWLPILSQLATPAAGQSANDKAADLLTLVSRLGASPRDQAWRAAAAKVLEQIISADGHWPDKRKTLLRKPLAPLFLEAQFLLSLAVVKNGNDPLVEDWRWIRGHMETLLRLAEEFALQLAERKLANGVLDFHDLEQFALKLLWDFTTGQPTAVAAGWRAKLEFIFVDEYQDINAAQDKIIQGLSREGVSPATANASVQAVAEKLEFDFAPPVSPVANRFLVGDVKQSIYRFRLADPKIFREYARGWRGDRGVTIPLSDNFRSREDLLKLVNSIFRLIMREETGGVAYDADAELQFGSPATRAEAGLTKNSAPCAELLIRFKNGRDEILEEEGGLLAGLDDAQREARLVAWRLKQLVTNQQEIFDGDKGVFRPVKWRDIAILLRSPRGRSEIYAKEFERAGIPLAVARGGFYDSVEILDLLSLLQLLDNPLQDVPCLAVLRSPLVGLTLDELAQIRLVAREKHFWTALVRSQLPEAGSANPAAEKIATFLERFSRWRKSARLVSLSQCLEEILAETHYADWLRAQPRGLQRAANLSGLLHLAQQFDQFQRQGLFRFLKFIEAQQAAEAEPEVSAGAAEDAVRLMSIHQSKGLEFPVVVLADLAKQFNERDLHAEIIFDEEFGLCPKVMPPHVNRRYPSLPHWLAQRRQKRELRGEELRLLYVALTRARDHLLLAASVTEKNWNEKWNQPQPATGQKIAGAKCFADWLALWFSNQAAVPQTEVQNHSSGNLEQLRWHAVPDSELEEGFVDGRGNEGAQADSIHWPSPTHDASELRQLEARLEWNYPFLAAAQRTAKSSVTTLRREAEDLDAEAEPIFPELEPEMPPRRQPVRNSTLSAPEIGAAHHKFLQHFMLEKADDLAAEADRLVQEHYLSPEERTALDLPALAIFWNSELGRKIRAHPSAVRRELPFTARFSPRELETITGIKAAAGLEQEFVIVQGVADLVVLPAAEIWLVDFKTDGLSAHELPEKVKIYSPQLRLYASALEKIFKRKVKLRVLYFLSTGQKAEI